MSKDNESDCDLCDVDGETYKGPTALFIDKINYQTPLKRKHGA